VAGKTAAERYPEVQIGRKVRFGRGDWESSGIMDAGRGAQALVSFGANVNQIGSGPAASRSAEFGAGARHRRGDRQGRWPTISITINA